MHITLQDALAPQVRTVLLNGVDVTSLTVEVDTTEGWVNVLVMGVDGRVLTDGLGKPLTLQVYGRVTFGIHQPYPCSFCLAVFDSPSVWAAHIKSHRFVPN